MLEYCKLSTLYTVSAFTKVYSEPSAYVVIRQVTQALANCHKNKILHLDLKESNILIAHNQANMLDPLCGHLPIEFKLADFGVSRDLNLKLTKNDYPVYKRGTPRYMAPE